MRSSYLGLAAVAITVAVAGCGGSSKTAATTTSAAVTPASTPASATPTTTQTTPAAKKAKAKVTHKREVAAKPKAAKPKAAAVKPATPAKPASKPKAPAKKPAAVKPGLDVSSRKLAVGTVLVTSQGRTLYTFAPDKDSMATCVGSCASVWPPLLLGAGETAVGISGVNQALLGSDPYPGGRRVATYKGWPLYNFAGDPGAGTDNGEGQNLNGGLWYVIATSGAQIMKH